MRVETEDEEFTPHQIWFATWKRFRKRALALQEKNKTITLRKEGRGEDPPDFSEKGKALAPIARLHKDGTLAWDDELVTRIEALTKKQ